MNREGYPPLGEDKILDVLPDLDLKDRRSRDGEPGKPARRPSPDRRRRRPRVVRFFLAFIMGIGLGWLFHAYLTSGALGGLESLSVPGYPVAGIRMERTPRVGGSYPRSTSFLLVPEQTTRLQYGRESLRYLALERRSTPWAAFLALFLSRPTLHIDGHPLQPGEDLTPFLKPEVSLSYRLLLRSINGGAPVAYFHLEVEMNGQAWLARANELIEPKAKRLTLEKALESEPKDLEILMAVGRIRWKQGETKGAIQAFERVLEEDAKHVEANKALATIYWKNQPKRALSIYQTLAQIDPEHRVAHYKKIAQLQRRLGRSPVETYRKILSLQKDDPDAKQELAGLYDGHVQNAQGWEKKGSLSKAIWEMKQALEIRSSKEGQLYLATLYNNLGYSLAKRGKFKEAIPKYEASLKLDDNPITLLNLADAYAKSGKEASAIKALDRALALKPKEPDTVKSIYLLWVDTLLSKKKYTTAARKLEEARERFPKDPEILKTLGMTYWKNGDHARALKALESLPSLLTSRPATERAEVYRNIGDLHRSLGDRGKALKTRLSHYDQALKAYEQALALNKTDVEAQKSWEEVAQERKTLKIKALQSS